MLSVCEAGEVAGILFCEGNHFPGFVAGMFSDLHTCQLLLMGRLRVIQNGQKSQTALNCVKSQMMLSTGCVCTVGEANMFTC